MRSKMIKNLFGSGVLIAMCLSVWGCQLLSKSSGDRFASVEIKGHSKAEIVAAAIQVFGQAGYISEGVEDELLFEREGPQWMQVAYGSNIQSGGPVTDRVRGQIVDLGNGTLRLQCSAYAVPSMVGDTGKEMQLLITRSGHYRDLLKLVAEKLSTTKTAP